MSLHKRENTKTCFNRKHTKTGETNKANTATQIKQETREITQRTHHKKNNIYIYIYIYIIYIYIYMYVYMNKIKTHETRITHHNNKHKHGETQEY